MRDLKDHVDSRNQAIERPVVAGGLPATLMPTDFSRTDFLRALFRALEEHEVRYCVLHTWEGLPENLPSDLDIAVHPRDRTKLSTVFGALRDQGFLPVQCLNYFVNAYYFVFYWFRGLVLESVAVDVILEHRRGGRILMRGEELVAGRRRHNSFWIPDPAVELHYLLGKMTWKRSAPPHTQRELKRLIEQVGPSQAEKIAVELYGEKWKRRVVGACQNATLPRILKDLPGLLLRTSILRHPFEMIRCLCGDSIRRIRRWTQPTGVFVVILGPDGVGKSTLVGQLVEKLGPAFRRHRIFHFRPQVIKPQVETGLPVTDPHGESVRGALGSVMQIFGFLADYWMGYWVIIRPLLARSGLVIFDRYFHDVMIDRKRYRYGGPLWLPRVLSRFVPPPDLLFLVLDADIEVILSRKREVVPDELKRLRSAYINMTLETSHAQLIKTDEGFEESVSAASGTIGLYMAERFGRRHSSWVARGDSVAREGKPAHAAQP